MVGRGGGLFRTESLLFINSNNVIGDFLSEKTWEAMHADATDGVIWPGYSVPFCQGGIAKYPGIFCFKI